MAASVHERPCFGGIDDGKSRTRAEAGNEQAGLAGSLHQPEHIIGGGLGKLRLCRLLLPGRQGFGIADRLYFRQFSAAVAVEIEHFFRFGGGIAHAQPHHETVELGFGQRESAELFGRVLRRHNDEGLGQAVGSAIHRNLLFLHGFKQGGLQFGRGAVDFVGQQEGVEHGAGVEFEFAFVRAVDVDAQEVGRQHVVGELHTAVVQAEHRRHTVRQRGFAYARHVFQ